VSPETFVHFEPNIVVVIISIRTIITFDDRSQRDQSIDDFLIAATIVVIIIIIIITIIIIPMPLLERLQGQRSVLR